LFTEIFDELLKLDSVYYTICPGAGGYDAAIIIAEKNVED
jgi:phosphomevalonate kinase